MLLCEFVSYCFNYYLCNILIIKFNIHCILNSCKEIPFYIVCCYYGCLLLMKTIKVLKSDYRDFTFIIKIDVSWNGIKIAVFVRSCEIAFSVIHILHENYYLNFIQSIWKINIYKLNISIPSPKSYFLQYNEIFIQQFSQNILIFLCFDQNNCPLSTKL